MNTSMAEILNYIKVWHMIIVSILLILVNVSARYILIKRLNKNDNITVNIDTANDKNDVDEFASKLVDKLKKAGVK
jgi:hypothetical protein